MNHRNPALSAAVACLVAVACFASVLRAAEQRKTSETIRFLRPSGDEFVTETEIHLTHAGEDFVVTSTTQRGRQKLTVTARFDAKNALSSAKVTLHQGDDAQSAAVAVAEGIARVVRDGKEANELACPPGVIVTSAPDWIDSFMAVRRYDPQGGATQVFPGLWIHPTREPLELTIKLTRLGHDAVTQGNKSANLDRLLLVLRGGSRYVVWRNRQGQLVRLMPATSDRGGIVLAGWEQATRDLKPRLSADGANK